MVFAAGIVAFLACRCFFFTQPRFGIGFFGLVTEKKQRLYKKQVNCMIAVEPPDEHLPRGRRSSSSRFSSALSCGTASENPLPPRMFRRTLLIVRAGMLFCVVVSPRTTTVRSYPQKTMWVDGWTRRLYRPTVPGRDSKINTSPTSSFNLKISYVWINQSDRVAHASRSHNIGRSLIPRIII